MSPLLKVAYVISWIPMVLVKLVGWALGLIFVPIALQISGGNQDHWPGILWLWGNEEDWDVPQWWYTDCVHAKNPIRRWFPNWWWYAMRNTTNNMRYLFKDRKRADIEWSGNWTSASMEPQDLIENGVAEAHRWIYSGPYAGYRKVWLNGNNKYSEFWIGWKLGSTVPGLGFTGQWRRKRKIGT